MTSRPQLSVDLIARVGGFEAGMKRAANAANGLTTRLRSAAGVAGAAAAGAFTAYAAASASFVKQAINRADELGEAAEKIGIPVEVLSSFEYASRFGGIAFEKLEGGLGRLIKAQVEVSRGSERFTEIFEALRVDAIDPLTGALRPTEEVLLQLADVFQGLPEGPKKAALAVEIFGKSGRDLIPFLNRGSEGIRKLTDESDEFGTTVSQQTAIQAGELNDQLDRLRASAQGAAQSVAERLLPDLVATNGPLQDFVDILKDPGIQDGLGSLISGGLELAGVLVQIGATVGNAGKAIAVLSGVSAPDGVNQNSVRELQERNTFLRSQIEGNEGRDAPILDVFREELRANEERIARLERGGKLARPASEKGASGGTSPKLPPDRIDRLFAPVSPDASADARRAATEAAREQEQAQKALDDALAATAEASAEFNAQLVAYRDEVKGPLAQAQTEWASREAQLQELAARGEISQAQLAEALSYTSELRKREVEAIEAQLSPAQQVIADLEQERRLLGLSNVEREIANALRYAGVDAMSAEGAQIAENIRLLAEERKRIQFGDDVRSGFEDTFASIISQSKSAKDALADLGSYITQLIAQRLGKQLSESLLGESGTPLGGGGSGGGIGGLFSSFLGSLFGGGRAAGGWVSPGKMYEVAENGPELLRVGNRQFLLPTATGGMVTPNARVGRGGSSVVQNISVTGRVDSRTASQLAAEASRAQRRVTARFGA